MNIKQFNGTYLSNDDRVIFRFNTTDNNDYKFWFTRRVTHYILLTTKQFLTKSLEQDKPNAVEKAISEFQQDVIKETTNLATPYEPGMQYPMGSDPVLVVEAKCDMIKAEEQTLISLDLMLPGGGNVNLKLPAATIQGLLLVLEQLNTQANWGDPTRVVFAEYTKPQHKQIH